MYSANRFPVKLYEGGPVGYAEGGLHDEAMAVRQAGRNGDGHLVHVNDEEFAEMVAEYGEPTINPETGMPEFFLGKLGKILKKVAPIAVSFIPGIGPVAGAALGAGMGALSGGGLKGALLGGVSGALGGAGAAGKIGGALGKGMSGVAQKAIGDAVIGGALGAATGQDPLKAALMSGGTSFLRGQFAPRAPAPSAQDVAPTTASPTTLSSAPDVITQGRGLFDYSIPSSQLSAVAPAASAGGAYVSPSVQASLSNAAAQPAAAPVKFMDRDFLGIKGLPNKYGLGASALAAAAAYDLMKPKDKITSQTPEEFFGPTFSGGGGRPAGGFRLASIPAAQEPQNIMSDYSNRYLSGYALGGDVGDEGQSEGNSFAVQGKGTGRSDEIPAMLSDGEYVFDAETVALLGDGSSKAGAKKLDDFRVKIRKQKGKRLAKGKFSQDAKHPEKYMAGGRI
jgi:hypothetical protein